jgi:hypothetical protein
MKPTEILIDERRSRNIPLGYSGRAMLSQHMEEEKKIRSNPASAAVVEAWHNDGRPTHMDYVIWAQEYYNKNVRDSDGTWNAYLSAALGCRAKLEYPVCRIF